MTRLIARLFKLKRITLDPKQRFVLTGALTIGAHNLYQKSLAMELTSRFRFKAREMRKYGIDIKPVGKAVKGIQSFNFSFKKEGRRAFWLTESQRVGVLEIIQSLPASKLEDWTFAAIAHQLTNSKQEFWELFNLKGEEVKATNVN